MKRYIVFFEMKCSWFKTLVVCLFLLVCSPSTIWGQTSDPGIGIIPAVAKINRTSGSFVFNHQTIIQSEKSNQSIVNILTDYLSDFKKRESKVVFIQPSAKFKSANTLIITSKGADKLPEEGYKLTVTPSNITLVGKGAGLFYGIQSFIQLLPTGNSKSIKLPCLSIEDYPRFAYRGMMLDVARHFYPVSFIKKYIDYLGMHKINTLHLHLTDDHGWRIEIKKYPKLAQISAWRKGTQPTMNYLLLNKTPHGGFYTQDEIREIVSYAKSRFIEIIPEIEMPGHTLEVLAAYPEISCTGGPFEMPLAWGLTKDIFCAGNEKTFEFLENVLTEVAELFPAKLVHIGGDEAPKDRWKVCPKCQLRMKNEGLKNEHELQSYFTKRMEKFLLSKGKRIIGWDEILEGGLAPEATVMSYRGIKAGIEAAKQHHDVIMTPATFLYFDYYQAEAVAEPQSIGNMLTLEKVYSYEPVPKELTPEEAKFIKGVQANLWTEFVPTSKSVEYMTMPRLAAAAEVAWSQPQLKSWDDFMRRMEFQYKRYEELGINYAKSASYVNQKISIDTISKKALIAFKTDRYLPEIYYTLDGSVPTPSSLKYTIPFNISTSAIVKAAVFNKGKLEKKESQRAYTIHSALYKKVRVDTASVWTQNGITNGIKAVADYRDKEWFKYKEKDLTVVLDLGKQMPISRISTSFLQHTDQFVFSPVSVEYSVSNDGIVFKPIEIIKSAASPDKPGTFIEDFKSMKTSAMSRYIKVSARNLGLSPITHYAPGQKLSIYLDEITVE